MNQYKDLIKLSLWSLCCAFGYHMLGFELFVVIVLALITFNMIESAPKENLKIENSK